MPNPSEPTLNSDQKIPGKPVNPEISGPELPVAGHVKLPRQIRSEALLNGDRELQIIHGDEIYRLSLTRQGKLILHK